MAHVGIDFGTANTSAALATPEGVVLLPLDPFGKNPVILRSVLYFDTDRVMSVGQEGINRYLEDGATGRLLRSIKAFLPAPSFRGTTIAGKFFEIERLVGLLLSHVRSRAGLAAQEEITRVVLGRPVVFSEDAENDRLAQRRLESAARFAGFTEVSFQYEPIAAALLFESTFPPGKEEVVLVGDFGGGTSDFTVMKLAGGNRHRDRRDDVLGLSGVYVGGDTFDSLIMWEKVAAHFGRYVQYPGLEGRLQPMPMPIMALLKEWHLTSFLRDKKTRDTIRSIRSRADHPELVRNLEELIDENLAMALFAAIEESKCDLTDAVATEVLFKELERPLGVRLERDEFETMIASPLNQIERAAREALRQANLKAEAIDRVFLTGGSSHIPAVQLIFEWMFGKEKLSSYDAFTSVAHGLALSAP